MNTLHIQPTPFGIPSAATPLEQSVDDAIRRLYPDSEATVLGLASALPFMLIGSFHSGHIDDPDANCSVLLLVWFASNPNRPLPDLVADGCDALDWEAHATNSYV